MDSWFREIHVPQAWRVYLAIGLDFREKKRACFASIGARVCCQSPTLPLYYEGKMMKAIFLQNYVFVLRTTTRLMVSFTDFLFPFSSKFSDLNFASYVLYNLPVLSRVTHSEPGLPTINSCQVVFTHLAKEKMSWQCTLSCLSVVAQE